MTRFGVNAIVVILLTAVLRAVRAARASEARSRSFLATAAHQLRTPVAALSTSVEALLLEGATPTQERLLANVAGEASRRRHHPSYLAPNPIVKNALLERVQRGPQAQRPADLLEY